MLRLLYYLGVYTTWKSAAGQTDSRQQTPSRATAETQRKPLYVAPSRCQGLRRIQWSICSLLCCIPDSTILCGIVWTSPGARTYYESCGPFCCIPGLTFIHRFFWPCLGVRFYRGPSGLFCPLFAPTPYKKGNQTEFRASLPLTQVPPTFLGLDVPSLHILPVREIPGMSTNSIMSFHNYVSKLVH